MDFHLQPTILHQGYGLLFLLKAMLSTNNCQSKSRIQLKRINLTRKLILNFQTILNPVQANLKYVGRRFKTNFIMFVKIAKFIVTLVFVNNASINKNTKAISFISTKEKVFVIVGSRRGGRNKDFARNMDNTHNQNKNWTQR